VTHPDDGMYYQACGLVQASPGRPIQPRLSVSLPEHEPELELHGTLLWSASYTDVLDFDPVIARPVTDTALAEPSFDLDGWFPAKPYMVNSFGNEDRLVFVPGQFNAGLDTERLWQVATFATFYSTSSDYLPPTIWDVITYGQSDTADFIVRARDASGIYKVWVTYQDTPGHWQSVELSEQGLDLWAGRISGLSGPVSFLIQVVDNAGNVSLSVNKGVFFTQLADLTLTKTVTPTVALPGDVVTFTLNYVNQDLAVARNVVLTDVLPAGLTPSGELIYDLGLVASGESGIITIRATVDYGTGASVLYNTAVIATSSDESDETNNTAWARLTVDETSCVEVFIQPPSVEMLVDDVFTVEVWIANVVDLGGFEFELNYDPTVVHVSDAELGDFPASTGRSWFPLGPEIDNAVGWMSFGGGSFGAEPGAQGMGIIAVITLQAVGEGSSALGLAEVQVTDTAGVPAEEVCVGDGYVTVVACAPVYGVDFGWNDPVRTGRSAAFTGTVQGGDLPYTFSWDLGGFYANGEVVEHTFTETVASAHDVLVGLEVTNECGWDQAEHWVQVWLFFDFGLDCDVDIVDIMASAARWNCGAGDQCYDPYYDVELDGDIDIVDIMQAAAWWGWECESGSR